MPGPPDKLQQMAAFDKACADFEGALAKVRMAYEQFFTGLERKPPVLAHNDLKKRMVQLRATGLKNVALRFKLQSLEQKLQTYERLWTRSMQELENGTSRRDLAKAKKRAAAPAPVAAAPKAPSGPKPQSGISEAKLESVYQAYVTAKRRCGEDTSRLSFESVSSALKKQVPGLLQKHGAKEIDFKVVIKDGRAVLRAIPK